MRPFKVRLGEELGEEGLDLGGVQQEFFRLAIAEALDPKYGMFYHNSKESRAPSFPLFQCLKSRSLHTLVLSLPYYC